MRLVLAGVAVVMALALAGPAQAALPAAPALPAGQAVDTAGSTAGAAAGAVQQQATSATATAKQVAAKAPRVRPPAIPAAPIAHPGAPATPALPDARRLARPHVAPPSAPAVPRVAAPAPAVPRVAAPAPAGTVTSAVEGVGREIGGYRKKLVQPLAAALVGNALGQVAAPVGALFAPATPLVGGLNDFGAWHLSTLIAAPSPGRAQTLGLSAERGAWRPPPSAPASSAPVSTAQTFQAASARPPAAEVGGRPVSPPPWTAPAPVAGGATAVFSAGGIFVSFLALLVLAALAAPRLMRRLDEVAAFVRPAPFLCALERPG